MRDAAGKILCAVMVFAISEIRIFLSITMPLSVSPKSWSADAKSIDNGTYDLSVKNPNGCQEIKHRSPAAIMGEIAALDSESAEALAGIQQLLK